MKLVFTLCIRHLRKYNDKSLKRKNWWNKN